jgi:hypothetical protein
VRHSEPDELNLRIADDVVGVATFRNVVVLIWRAGTHASGIERLAPVLHRFAESHPAGIGMVVIMSPDHALPDPGTRNAAGALFKSLAHPLLFQIAVLEAGGIMVNLLRSVLTAFALTTSKQRTFLARSLDEAAEWGASRAGMDVTTLKGALNSARTAYAARLESSPKLR